MIEFNVRRKQGPTLLLTMLRCMTQGKEPSVRQLALLLFRNTITLNMKLDEALSRPRARVPPSIVQMLLVLQVQNTCKNPLCICVCHLYVFIFFPLREWCTGCSWVTRCDRGLPEAGVTHSEGGVTLPGNTWTLCTRLRRHTLFMHYRYALWFSIN